MKSLALLASSIIILGLANINLASANPQADDRQSLIQERMDLLSSAQNMMQLEIQSHFKRAQSIQTYQMCIQAAMVKDDFKSCKMKLEKDQTMLDDEVASLRKLNQ